MTEKVKKELFDCMGNLIAGSMTDNMFFELPYDVDPYSPYYEPMIKQAVQYKREGNYDDAIKCYIDIFKREKRFNTEIVRYLCKVLICDGELVLAYQLLAGAYYALSIKCGPHPNPFVPSIPWAQAEDGAKLLNACSVLANSWDVGTFSNYVASVAGNPTYLPKRSHFQLISQAEEVVLITNKNIDKIQKS